MHLLYCFSPPQWIPLLCHSFSWHGKLLCIFDTQFDTLIAITSMLHACSLAFIRLHVASCSMPPCLWACWGDPSPQIITQGLMNNNYHFLRTLNVPNALVRSFSALCYLTLTAKLKARDCLLPFLLSRSSNWFAQFLQLVRGGARIWIQSVCFLTSGSSSSFLSQEVW